VIPAIHNFEENMITLEKDVKTSTEIVKRFDEILGDKASKLVVDRLIDEVHSNYLLKERYGKDRREGRWQGF
jgi:hypothetical protein